MDGFLSLLGNVELGLATALLPVNLGYCLLGVFLGTLVGVLPGIGPLAAISMLYPITFHLDPTSALIMLAGIFYGTSYGGSIAAILLNVPGTASSAVACIDGYPMSKQGRAGVALFATTIASFIGGSIGILLMMLFAPSIVEIALNFGSAEYFSLMILGLVAASSMSGESVVKGIAMVTVGILLGNVGMDIYIGIPRFTFGMVELRDGISLVALAMGMFGIAEVIASVRAVKSGSIQKVTFRTMVPTRDDTRRSWKPILRGSAIGSFFGTLPGTGATVASFMAYALEKRIAKEPKRFGKGAIEGVCAPESANNAADQTAFIPTMTLGIPGSPTMALMLGVFMIHGISPGPQLMATHPDLFWGVVMSFWIGNLLLLVLNIPLIGLWVRMLQIPYHLLYPSIVVLICVGVYSVTRNSFDVWLTIAFGLLGYGIRYFGFPGAPLILGFVLGPMMEEHFRRAMLLSRGSFPTFVERPISATFLAVTVLILAWSIYTTVRAVRNRRSLPVEQE
jgi:TctA family transporter